MRFEGLYKSGNHVLRIVGKYFLDKEFLEPETASHRDFYNVRKVDTHVHHSTCMKLKHLLKFIKSKLRKETDELACCGSDPPHEKKSK